MFVELHMIQSFAPSNLNRDDTNNPKDCEFGGVRRARISSQCIKRAIRGTPVFRQVTSAELGIRTRRLVSQIRKPLLAAGKTEADVNVVATVFAEAYAGSMDSEKPEQTKVLLFLSESEIEYIGTQLLAKWDVLLPAARGFYQSEAPKQDAERKKGKKEARKIPEFKDVLDKDFVRRFEKHTGAPDIAMFGRMLAERPETNINAACQVAHAISTHRVTMEMDFFTAVDDLQQEAEPGAGMMGFTGYNSACFYRYARIDWRQLVKNLDGDAPLARRTVEGFLRAANEAIPTGKQNSFAAQNPPSFTLAVVRTNAMSGSLANAFETPVRPARDGGLVAPSVAALDAYWGRLVAVYGTDAIARVAALALDPGIALTNLQDALLPDFETWLEAVVSALPQEAVV
ncbi:MAG: type I-E CRISPR-associated protein Cas7/Cse4/CasC [Anaerolineae bacterium]|nr:type I-E CRISPR-associated protein Cas7/Cse4/CasC [Anaerolineae bacterium]